MIPTCADYDLFTREADQDAIPREITDRLRGKLVIGLVGSIRSKSYRTREALQLFAEICRRRRDAHLLCLTGQVAQMKPMLFEAGIAASDYTLLSVPHEEMPAWLSLMGWALLLLSQSDAKRGSMPTKLAEFFACEVRIALYGCNSEVADKVRECGAGIVLQDLSLDELKRAAQEISSLPFSPDATVRVRTLTRAYFGLESGVRQYEGVYNRILGTETSSNSRAVQQGQI